MYHDTFDHRPEVRNHKKMTCCYCLRSDSFGRSPNVSCDIEVSKSNFGMNAWLPQASYPCANLSGTSYCILLGLQGTTSHDATVYIRTENDHEATVSPFGRMRFLIFFSSRVRHLRYQTTNVPLHPDSPLHRYNKKTDFLM